MTDQKITPDDLQAKFGELREEVEVVTSDVRENATRLGIVALVFALILVYLLGVKRGKRNRSVVELRRF